MAFLKKTLKAGVEIQFIFTWFISQTITTRDSLCNKGSLNKAQALRQLFSAMPVRRNGLRTIPCRSIIFKITAQCAYYIIMMFFFNVKLVVKIKSNFGL